MWRWSCMIMSYHVDSFRLRPPWRIHPLPAAGNACFNCLKCWQATRWTLSSRGGGEGLLGLHKSMAITVSQLTNFCYEFGWIWQGTNDIWIKRPWTEPTNTSETSIWSTTVLSLLTIPLWATFVGHTKTLQKSHTKYLLDSLLWYLHLRHLGTGAWRGAAARGVGRCHVGGRNSTWFCAPFTYVPCESIPYIPCSKMHGFPACTGSNGSKVWGATTNSWTGGLRTHPHWHPQHSKQLGIFWCRCF